MAVGIIFIALIILNLDSFGGQCALILMKQGFTDQEKADRTNNRPGYCQIKWIAGFILMAVVSCLSVTCEAWVPLVLSSSTEATAIGSGVVLSIFWLKEKFYPWYDIPALILIIFGCLGIILQADKSAEGIDFTELVSLVLSRKSITYLCFIALFFVFTGVSLYVLMKSMESYEKEIEKYAEKELQWNQQDMIQIREQQKNRTYDINLGYSEEQQQEPLVPGQEPGYDTKSCEDCYAKTCAGGPQRPSRLLLLLINDLSFETTAKIGKKFYLLKLFNKVPMLAAVAVLGCLSGLNQTVFRFAGLAIRDGKNVGSPFVMFMATLGALGSASQIAILNLAIKLYKQIDVIPCYEASLTIMTVVCGLVLFDESAEYTWKEMMGIFLAIFFVCIGIFIIAAKENMKEKIDLKRKAMKATEEQETEVEQLESEFQETIQQQETWEIELDDDDQQPEEQKEEEEVKQLTQEELILNYLNLNF